MTSIASISSKGFASRNVLKSLGIAPKRERGNETDVQEAATPRGQEAGGALRGQSRDRRAPDL